MKMRIAMRKLILLMVLAIVSSGAMADWAEMGENDTFVLYADFTTIRRVANRVKMWALYDFKQVQYISGEPFLSMKSQNQYDCIEENVQSIYSSFHFRNMGNGNTVSIQSNPPSSWDPVSPGSAENLLWKIACRKQ